jgi:hypothetical protein
MSEQTRPAYNRAAKAAVAGIAVAAGLLSSILVAQAQATRGDRQDVSGSAANPPARSGQSSPQGHPGPIDTGSGGAPAANPQGETPPGMQSNPSSASGASQPPTKDQ